MADETNAMDDTVDVDTADFDAVVDTPAPPQEGVVPPPPTPPSAGWKAVLAFYIMLITMVLFQSFIVWAKKEHPRRYLQVTLVGLWLVPPCLALSSLYWRFLGVWATWSLITGIMVHRATQKPLAGDTPRRIYSWFLLSHQVTFPIAIAGVLLVLGDFLGLGPILALMLSPETQILLFWYGLYFGVLTRDAAEVCSDLLAGRLGVGRSSEGGPSLGYSNAHCGICKLALAGERRTMRAVGPEGDGVPSGAWAKETKRLTCKHAFHDYCIRGWTMVGKKDMCPTCLEKVDLKHFHEDRPWERANVAWGQLLDMFRYMVVWFPILMTAMHLLFWEFGLLPPNPHKEGPATTTAPAPATG